MSLDRLKNVRNALFFIFCIIAILLIVLFYDDAEAFAAGSHQLVRNGTDQLPAPMFTVSEEWELLHLAQAEAGNQGAEGQALVMMVVINRVSAGFGEDIHEVVTAPYQFSTVRSGAWLADPNDDSFEALEMIRSGWDESQGALFFRTVASGHFEWATYMFNHGDHNFYR